MAVAAGTATLASAWVIWQNAGIYGAAAVGADAQSGRAAVGVAEVWPVVQLRSPRRARTRWARGRRIDGDPRRSGVLEEPVPCLGTPASADITFLRCCSRRRCGDDAGMGPTGARRTIPLAAVDPPMGPDVDLQDGGPGGRARRADPQGRALRGAVRHPGRRLSLTVTGKIAAALASLT